MFNSYSFSMFIIYICAPGEIMHIKSPARKCAVLINVKCSIFQRTLLDYSVGDLVMRSIFPSIATDSTESKDSTWLSACGESEFYKYEAHAELN